MLLEPTTWNVVIVGRWNPALYTPSAVSKRIFGLAEGTPVEVYLSIDDILPAQIVHQGIKIVGSSGRLEIATVKPSFSELRRAMGIGKLELDRLPETPLKAAGINVRFGGDDFPSPLREKFSQNLDDLFADTELELTGRGFKRTLKFGSGGLTVAVDLPPSSAAEVLFNFEKQSSSAAALAEWLAQPIESIQDNVAKVMEKVFGLTKDVDYVRERSDGDVN